MCILTFVRSNPVQRLYEFKLWLTVNSEILSVFKIQCMDIDIYFCRLR